MSEYKLDNETADKILSGRDLVKIAKPFSKGALKIVVGQIIKKPTSKTADQNEEYIIDIFDESSHITEMEGRYYSNKEIEEIKAAARAEAWKEATLAGLSAQSGIPIAELEAKWDSGQFDGSEAKALRAQWRQAVENYAQRCGVDPKHLRGKIVSKEEFKKKFG